jgi:hypothetical protein
MNEKSDREFRELLKKSLPPMGGELERDLWPKMLRRMDEKSHRVPWFDWALLGLLVLWLLVFPGWIPVLLYHL